MAFWNILNFNKTPNSGFERIVYKQVLKRRARCMFQMY